MFADCMHRRADGAAHDESVERWARWMKPFWVSIDKYAKLVHQMPEGSPALSDIEDMSPFMKDDERVFVKETTDKLVRVVRELTDLVYVLEKNPADR
eukprot:6315242-Pyramimonas_sp.AAC.1